MYILGSLFQALTANRIRFNPRREGILIGLEILDLLVFE
jgi:hypothetical protein